MLIEEIQSLNSKNTIYFSSLILVIIAMGGVIAYLIIRRPKEASTAPTNTSMLQQEINELKQITETISKQHAHKHKLLKMYPNQSKRK